MVKHTQQFVSKLLTNCLSMFDLSVGLALKGLVLPFENYTKLKEVDWFRCNTHPTEQHLSLRHIQGSVKHLMKLFCENS